IIPQLLQWHPFSDEQQALMAANADYPLFTLIFDREAYSPAFFKRLWDTHRIAVVTYRKNVKDTVAVHMFGRWIQENFFRYMRQDYDMDRILQYKTMNMHSRRRSRPQT
ncbi:MAG: hypothetical protein LBT78_09910, partial [Tannerella sp.]|nr:hypothetical protein [Tannerella sp.]